MLQQAHTSDIMELKAQSIIVLWRLCHSAILLLLPLDDCAAGRIAMLRAVLLVLSG
jgi:hypothetical protein